MFEVPRDVYDSMGEHPTDFYFLEVTYLNHQRGF